MGTRGAIGYIIEGKEKVTYNHFDSYPSCLGQTMLEYCKKFTPKAIAKVAKEILLVSEREKPTPEQIRKCNVSGTTDLHVSNQSTEDWYCLLRGMQGEPEKYHDTAIRFMIDNAGFLYDSLFCEWAYLVNVDKGVLEIYKGFNKDKTAAGRYASICKDKEKKYYGVKLIDELSLTAIRKMKKADFEALIEKWEKIGREEE